jgi:hypothetical protein
MSNESMTEIKPCASSRWTLDYVPDAATARWHGNSNYEPLEGCGVHLCGQTDDGQQPTTVANYRMRDATEARDLWQIARSVAECASRDEEDFIVDLVLPEGIVADFSSNRQLWPRAIEAWNAVGTGAALKTTPAPEDTP